MMLLSVLMMPSRCLTLCEQMGLLCMSALRACCVVFEPLPACLRFNVFVYWTQWQTVWCRILLYRLLVPAVSAIIFIVSVAVFHYWVPQEKAISLSRCSLRWIWMLNHRSLAVALNGPVQAWAYYNSTKCRSLIKACMVWNSFKK